MLSPNNPNLTLAHSHPSPLTTKKVSAIRIQPKPYSRELMPRFDAVTLRTEVCFLLLLSEDFYQHPSARENQPEDEASPKELNPSLKEIRWLTRTQHTCAPHPHPAWGLSPLSFLLSTHHTSSCLNQFKPNSFYVTHQVLSHASVRKQVSLPFLFGKYCRYKQKWRMSWSVSLSN